MILSIYLGRGYISAVLFNTEPFTVKSKAFVEIGYDADTFFSFSTYKHLEDLLKSRFELSNDDFATTTKILVKAGANNTTDINGWDTTNSLQQILDSVSGRIILFSEETLESQYISDQKKMNEYANRTMYHSLLPHELLFEALESEALKYWAQYDAPKANLREVIFSCYKYDKDSSQKIEKKLLKILSKACIANKIIEITYDYGFFLIPIIAALIQQKKDPKEFFTQNPIHVDSKVVIIPGMDDQLEFLDNKSEVFNETEVVEGLVNLKVDEGETIIIKSKNPKKTVHLELMGCKNGIYIDTSNKKNEK